MAIVRWTPVKDLLNIQDRMNRLFEDSVRGSRPEDQEELATGTWMPVVDVYETESAVVLKAELPRCQRKDIGVEIENRTLTLSGERRFGEEASRENFHCIERAYGKFRRHFALPDCIDTQGVAADYREGILKVVLPKLASSQRKQIRINVS